MEGEGVSATFTMPTSSVNAATKKSVWMISTQLVKKAAPPPGPGPPAGRFWLASARNNASGPPQKCRHVPAHQPKDLARPRILYDPAIDELQGLPGGARPAIAVIH